MICFSFDKICLFFRLNTFVVFFDGAGEVCELLWGVETTKTAASQIMRFFAG